MCEQFKFRGSTLLLVPTVKNRNTNEEKLNSQIHESIEFCPQIFILRTCPNPNRRPHYVQT
jgi:hypothetical protein